MSRTEPFDLTGKVALVTGGGTHLGKAMATALATHGAETFIAGRRPNVLDGAAMEIREMGGQCQPVACDITDAEGTEAMMASIVAAAGSIDIAVCNAGANAESSYPPDTDIESLYDTFQSHVVGTINTANSAARRMIDGGGGSIVTISSVHGSLAADPRMYIGIRRPRRSSLAYQTAKSSIMGVTRNLAAELGRHGIRVNCISPGHFPKQGEDPEFVRRVVNGNALGVQGVPADLAGPVLLLASDAGRFITGHNLVVDGGWSIW